MSPFGPLNPVGPVWPGRPAGERQERDKSGLRKPGPEDERDEAGEEPSPGGQSGDGKPPARGGIVDEYA